MVQVSQHPGERGVFSHLDLQYQYPPAGSSQPHGKQRETSGNIPFPADFFVSTRVENIPEVFCLLLSNNPGLKEVLPFWDFNLILAHTQHWDLFLFGILPWYQPAQSTSSKKKTSNKKNKEKHGRQRRNLETFTLIFGYAKNPLASNREASGCFGKSFFAIYMREHNNSFLGEKPNPDFLFLGHFRPWPFASPPGKRYPFPTKTKGENESETVDIPGTQSVQNLRKFKAYRKLLFIRKNWSSKCHQFVFLSFKFSHFIYSPFPHRCSVPRWFFPLEFLLTLKCP